MNLTLHIFRKDIRQFRILLSVWFGILLLHLSVDAGWVGQIAYSAKNGFENGANGWTGFVPVVAFLLVILLPTFAVLTDSPARREGFLATRPVPKGDLVLAKLLFILLLIVVPFVLLESLHLVLAGVPGWVVARGTFERLVMAVPLAFGFGAYAALWPGVARWARACGIIFGCYLVVGFTLALLNFLFQIDFGGISRLPDFMALNFATVFMVLFAAWHSRAYHGAPARWGGLAVIAVAMFAIMHFWPWKMFELKPANPAAAEAIVDQAGLEITPLHFYLSKVDDPRHSSPMFSIVLQPTAKPLPADYTLEWNRNRAQLMREDGPEFSGNHGTGHPIFNYYYWGASLEYDDCAALAPVFPADVLFRQDAYMNYNRGYSAVTFDNYDLPAAKAELATPLILHAKLDGCVYKWTKIADLPLVADTVSKDEFGSWKFIAVAPEGSDMNGSRMFLQRRQIELGTATDSRCSSKEYGPLSRITFVVYDPVTHVVSMPETATAQNGSRSADTALPQYAEVLNFDNRKPFTAEEIARDRLFIYQKTWVGTAERDWQPPAFTINDKLMPVDGRTGGYGDPMPQPEFERRLAALRVPALDASRAEVSRYLLEFLRLVDAGRFPLRADNPHTQQLAAYVPTQLDLMIDGLSVMDGPARQTMLNAITLGATEGQKPAIIGALSREPELAEVITTRGWLDDAHDEVLQLVQYPHYLPATALQAIAWFQDTNTYPRLLEEFDQNPAPALLETFRALPGLDPALREIVNRHWRENSLVYREHQGPWEMFSGAFEQAASYGDAATLQRAFLFLPDADIKDNNLNYYLASSIRSAVWIPDLKPAELEDNSHVLAWMRQHRAEDFVYSPGLRQFVLKSIYTGDTAANSHP